MKENPIEPPAKVTRRLSWRILVAIAVAIISVSAGYYLIVQDSVVELTITDGSVSGTVQGDFLETIEDDPIWSFFNATTYADRTDQPVSTLTLQIVSHTYWDETWNSVVTAIFLKATGNIDSELDVRNLAIECNQTAYYTTMESLEISRKGVNVSLDLKSGPDILDTGSATLQVELINRTVGDAIYEFSFSSNMLVRAYGEDNLADRFMCFRAIVNGDIEPEFSVSVSISFVNTSAVS